jgi:hypothetical protein
MATAANLRDHLQGQGYDSPDCSATDGAAEDWHDLIVSGIGSIRVCVNPAYSSVNVYVFDAYLNCEWRVSLSTGTPDAVIIATIEAAEWQLAAKRGGPVTPAQAEAAR